MTSCPTVLVMGGSGVLGRALCRRFGHAGWHVGIHYYSHRAAALEVAKEIRTHGGNAVVYHADATQFSEVCKLARELKTHWHRLDVLICALGQATSQLLLRIPPHVWEKTLHTNLTGVFNCLRALSPLFLEQGEGSVIVIGSLASTRGARGQVAYATAKAGLLGLMRTTALEWGPANIRVNMVFPGWHPSPLAGSHFPAGISHLDHCLGRTPQLHEVVDTVFHLAQLRDISGQVFNLDSRLW
ncbi:MAG: SDR family oxidoreductase [Nitrospirae bacterium]|nr:MAG: SDR family oxidoreductase [Nitrospirota bacterium]